MPIPLPNLDDRTYADLVAELRTQIPRYAPAWTDHNPSDPGIMLVELFAWLAEGLIYRLNRITEASELRLVRLLGAVSDDLPQARIEAIAGLRERWRAITAEDFEFLVLNNPDLNLARAKCLPELDLEHATPDTLCPGHVSLIVVPRSFDGRQPLESDLVTRTKMFLDERRLITCQVHVAPPAYARVAIQAEVVGSTRRRAADLDGQIKTTLADFFHPLDGGPQGGGWPFGRDVYASEVHQVIENTPDVDHVERLTLQQETQATEDIAWEDAGDAIATPAHGLVDFDREASTIRLLSRA
jgi:hypothetical protein